MARLPADVRMNSTAGVRWAPAVESAAYFVVSEAVTNALKHAPGSRVAVLLADVQGALQVEVRDDGPGFGAPSASARGLTGLRDRVESFGGSFVVRSAPGDGTCVRRLSPERWCDAWCCDS